MVPDGVQIKIINDASMFVKDSITDVVREMLIAAALTGLIVLLLLGSGRATVIVATSIPLSILTSLIGLHMAGESINLMTLGGLALAVGILVDDATVMIENIDTHLAMNKPLEDGDHRRRQSDRHPDVRRHVKHCHRLAPALRSQRRIRLAVHADGEGGHLRDARLLRLVAHAGADHGEIYA